MNKSSQQLSEDDNDEDIAEEAEGEKENEWDNGEMIEEEPSWFLSDTSSAYHDSQTETETETEHEDDETDNSQRKRYIPYKPIERLWKCSQSYEEIIAFVKKILFCIPDWLHSHRPARGLL